MGCARVTLTVYVCRRRVWTAWGPRGHWSKAQWSLGPLLGPSWAPAVQSLSGPPRPSHGEWSLGLKGPSWALPGPAGSPCMGPPGPLGPSCPLLSAALMLGAQPLLSLLHQMPLLHHTMQLYSATVEAESKKYGVIPQRPNGGMT